MPPHAQMSDRIAATARLIGQAGSHRTHGRPLPHREHRRHPAPPSIGFAPVAPLLEQLPPTGHLRVVGVLDLQPGRLHAVAVVGTDLPDFFGPVATGEWRRSDRLVVLRSSSCQREPASPASAPRHRRPDVSL